MSALVVEKILITQQAGNGWDVVVEIRHAPYYTLKADKSPAFFQCGDAPAAVSVRSLMRISCRFDVSEKFEKFLQTYVM
jgi:hypothetical protein